MDSAQILERSEVDSLLKQPHAINAVANLVREGKIDIDVATEAIVREQERPRNVLRRFFVAFSEALFR
jgi:UPF0288 family protein (methanogenesis marker protein 3)